MNDDAQLRLLNRITEKINLGTSLEQVVDFVYESLREFVPYNRIAVAVTDERGERLTILTVRSDGKAVLDKGYSGTIAGSSLEPLIREGRARILNDLQDYLEKKPKSDSTRLIVREGMRSSLTLPLFAQGRPVGVMFFSSREPKVYTAEHETFLRGIVGSISIAVERSRLLEALREKSEYLEDLLQHSADAIIVVEREGRIRTWNEGARRIFGYASDEIVGRSFEVLLTPELRESGELARIREWVEKEGFLKDYETVRLAKDGRRVTVNLTSTLLRDRKGRILGRSAILRDVTGIKKLQEEVVKSQSLAAIGELSATVAHEIKNPLAGISGAIQVLRDAIPATDHRRLIMEEILEQIRRLDNTVRDLLSFARPAMPVRKEFRLNETLARSWSLLSPQPVASSVRFTLSGDEGVCVKADEQLLDQVWINLFQNAVEAMPQGGELHVRVSNGPTVRVEVRDTGSGVDPAHAARLFRPFFSTKTRGTGLGLAISRKIIEAHGGTIWIDSAPKKGSKVFVELPQ